MAACSKKTHTSLCTDHKNQRKTPDLCVEKTTYTKGRQQMQKCLASSHILFRWQIWQGWTRYLCLPRWNHRSKKTQSKVYIYIYQVVLKRRALMHLGALELSRQTPTPMCNNSLLTTRLYQTKSKKKLAKTTVHRHTLNYILEWSLLISFN
jgi:hypothetical protein